jgi:glycosyltransferase involved in cell wall biosynthesis
MLKITSNTILRNDMPFVGDVLRHVEPFVDEMLITISTRSNDGTLEEVKKFVDEFPLKVKLDFETVKDPKELTQVRQEQLDNSKGDWILFLDGDDWWPSNRLQYCISYLDSDIDGLAVSPYQVLDKKRYERQWTHMGFTKFFRRVPGVHYRGDWPRDLIYRGDTMLYWKTNLRVPMLPCMFYHLSHLKKSSFRTDGTVEGFKQEISVENFFNGLNKEDVKEIYGCIRRHK